MPVDTSKANEVWARYQWLRDNGHNDFIEKVKKCEDFFAGAQWEKADLALLRVQRRPALTINKIISTMANVMGEQIFNRTDIAFRPRNEGATSEVADALTKVFMQIQDNNHLDWVRSDVFCDGIIGSRGFFDVRLDFSDSLRGEVRIEQLNPRNVLIDADADDYDPDKWNDVITTKWMTIDEIELMYSKADADLLRTKLRGGASSGYFAYGVDSLDIDRQRFGSPNASVPFGMPYGAEASGAARSVRVIERQWRKLDMMLHLVNLTTGDTRPVPADWTTEQINAYLMENPDYATTKRLVRRIRWTVVADNIVLHDDWSPYKHFTIVPYFPYFLRGRTIGLVENLLGPQELLNKTSSQELHVVNTTANSGWKVKANALKNMTVSELEQKGAQTGLVMELDEINNAEKIQPNQTPSGLDRISYKAEDHIKSISGVSDYMQGFAREDVAAKAVNSNKQSGQANLAKVMDNMNRTDHILARNILDLVQEYYTEQRLVFITTDKLQGTTEQMMVNEITPEGRIANDLTLGEYAVVVTNQPERDTFEDSQFDQALYLRTEAGVPIPDRFLIQASRLRDKAEVIKALEGDKESPEAQQAAQLEARRKEAEVAKTEAEVAERQADAELKRVRAQKEAVETQKEANATDEQAAEMLKLQQEQELAYEKLDQDMALQRERMAEEFALKREELQQKLQLEREAAAQKQMTDRIAAVTAARQQPAAKPSATPEKQP